MNAFKVIGGGGGHDQNQTKPKTNKKTHQKKPTKPSTPKPEGSSS